MLILLLLLDLAFSFLFSKNVADLAFLFMDDFAALPCNDDAVVNILSDWTFLLLLLDFLPFFSPFGEIISDFDDFDSFISGMIIFLARRFLGEFLAPFGSCCRRIVRQVCFLPPRRRCCSLRDPIRLPLLLFLFFSLARLSGDILRGTMTKSIVEMNVFIHLL